jgi:hypothetical protein
MMFERFALALEDTLAMVRERGLAPAIAAEASDASHASENVTFAVRT